MLELYEDGDRVLEAAPSPKERLAALSRRAVEELRQKGAVSQRTKAALRQAQAAFDRAAASVQDVQRRFVQEVPAPLRESAGKLYDSLRRGKLDTDSLKKLGVAEGKKQLERFAKEHGSEALRKAVPDLKLPSGVPVGAAIDFILKGKFTAESVAKAAYSAVKESAETFIRTETGLPIRLPTKFTAKELGRTFTGLIPKDFCAAVDLGLTVAGQAAASAITSVLAGAGVGSVIPGLGTVVGLGVALGIGALKDALKEKPPPHARVCKSKITCPPVPELSPIELLLWVSVKEGPVAEALAKEQAKRYCGKGPIVDCNIFLSMLGRKAFDLSKTTPQVLGLLQLQRLIPAYERAPRQVLFYDPKNHKLVRVASRVGIDMQFLLTQMRQRRDLLSGFVSRANSVGSMTASNLATFRWELITELTNAAVQFQNHPTDDTKTWLAQVSQYLQRLLQREQGVVAERQKQIAQGQRRAEELRQRDPARYAELRAKTAQVE